MQTDYRLIRHPARHQLIAYAESMVDRRTAISAPLAGHITACAQCSAEVRAIRASLEFAELAPELEPTQQLTAQILMEAQRTRQHLVQQRSGATAIMAVRTLAYAAALVAVAGVSFNMAVSDPAAPLHQPVALSQPVVAAPVVDPAQDAMRAAAEIKTLSGTAVGLAERGPQTVREREHLRAVSVMGGDLVKAQRALALNPASVRATQVVHTSLQRQAETLRRLYADRTL
jgi:hypothetical protein